MATKPSTPATPPAQDAQQNSQPVGTPPGGGRWTWSAAQGAWVPVQDINETPQE